jgi:hypothetical protein
MQTFVTIFMLVLTLTMRDRTLAVTSMAPAASSSSTPIFCADALSRASPSVCRIAGWTSEIKSVCALTSHDQRIQVMLSIFRPSMALSLEKPVFLG